jgi:penicillin-insensitive murein endopeptidase
MADAPLSLGPDMGKIFWPLTIIMAVILPLNTVTAQDKGTLNPPALAPLHITKTTPAKQIFARKTTPSDDQPEVIGFYAKGCLAGGQAMPITNEAWQVMRLSRHRYWGHPKLLQFLKRMAQKDRADDIWPGFLIGDMSQPRGGPMITGHASHQIGLDADIWLTPMPDHVLSRAERETMPAIDLVRSDGRDIDPQHWREQHIAFIRSLAEQEEVQRIFVNPAIKKAMCRQLKGDRSWMSKVRPMYGHNYHMHIRLSCPAGEHHCEAQEPPPQGDGCDASLDWWFSEEGMHPPPQKPKPPLTMANLPAACQRLVDEP